ncbi:MAG: HAD-IA family hydrolase [Notoacmeibacter sp.]|nr:HAD-IA family hydrolase [Notoacmeibacter sp.]MCC0033043.1 HAD-IA family hydrolase [Brucellaceae bacterium]
MPGPALVIFDFDGTLADSEIVAARVEAKLLAEAGYPVSAEEICERFSGLSFRKILETIESEAGIPFQASLIDRCEKDVDSRLKREVKPIEGAREALLAAGPNRCICSNSSSERLDIELAATGLAPFIGGPVWSAKSLEGVREKPAPDVFLHAAREAGAKPADCFVIEDSVHGVHGARAAGMRVIGFTGGSHAYPGLADRLSDAGAETVISRLADLPAMLKALSEFGLID